MSMVLPELKVLKFYRCYILRRVFIAQFQGLEDFSFILSLCLQGLNVCFNGRDWGRNRIDVGLRSGGCGLGSICGANVLRAGGGLIVLAGTVARLSAPKT